MCCAAQRCAALRGAAQRCAALRRDPEPAGPGPGREPGPAPGSRAGAAIRAGAGFPSRRRAPEPAPGSRPGAVIPSRRRDPEPGQARAGILSRAPARPGPGNANLEQLFVEQIAARRPRTRIHQKSFRAPTCTRVRTLGRLLNSKVFLDPVHVCRSAHWRGIGERAPECHPMAPSVPPCDK